MTRPASGIAFGAYRLDPDGARLWRGSEPLPLQPRPLAVLCYLVAHPGEVVARDTLIQTLWAGTHVTKAVLKVAVRAIREALDDDPEAPRYIETVGREGYRFIGLDGAPRRARSPGPAADDAMVGRGADLARLRAHLDRARGAARMLVVVTGEAGIGKTTLIDRFVDEVERTGGAWVGRGQCLEHYGEGEAYLPVLEAVGRLARDDATGEIAAVLRRHAPTWASQLPALDAPRGTRPVRTATAPARMLREMADALEVVAARRTVVVVLEDLQWSDRSTVDLLAYVARRRPPARLLIVASLRPVDAIVHDHPVRALTQELCASGQCDDLALELLSLDDVTAFLDARFGPARGDDLRRLPARIYERTDGNPLFMVNVVDDLLARQVLVRRDGRWTVVGSVATATERIPTSLREFIGRRMSSLHASARQLLEAASVAGQVFAVVALAAALDADAGVLEEQCEQLAARGEMIADAGVAEWPDGSLSGRYRFQHALYRHALYEGIGETRRVQLHRAIGLREEAGFAARAGERAAQLAMHFARGRDHARALGYHEIAGRTALDRHAPHEAEAHFGAAIDALAHEPAGAVRDERELALVVASATLRMATRGYGAPETEAAFARARALCDGLPASPQRHPVVRGLVSYHHVRAELATAHDLGEDLLARAAQRPGDRALRVQAHYGHGATLFHMGALEAARPHLAAALADYDPATHRDHVAVYGGYDPGVGCSLWLAWTLALLGRLDEARARDRDGLALARRLGDAFTLAWAWHAAGVSQQVFGDWIGSETSSAEAMRLAEEHGFPHVLGMATVNRGWALLMQGKAAAGIPLLRDGVAAVEATGAGLVRPSYLGMLAAADAIEGNREAAGRRFDEALAEVERTGERLHEAGLLVGKSHFLAAGGRTSRRAADVAEECLQRALAVARGQGARVVELRAAVALGRHWRKSGRGHDARALVDGALAPFAGVGPLVPEIASARQLLDELG